MGRWFIENQGSSTQAGRGCFGSSSGGVGPIKYVGFNEKKQGTGDFVNSHHGAFPTIVMHHFQ